MNGTTSPNSNAAAVDPRADYIAGLRQLAGLLESDEQLSLPYDGRTSALSVFTRTLDEAVAWRAALDNPGHHVDNSGNYKVRIDGQIASVCVRVYVADDVALLDPPPPVQRVVHPALTGEATESEVPA